MNRSRLRLKRWLAAVLIALLWIVIALAWSWFLITLSFEHTLSTLLETHTRQLAALAHDNLAASPNGEDTLRSELQHQLQADQSLAYLMIWENGTIKYHGDPDYEETALNVDTWPSFEPGQNSRVSRIKSGPWDPPLGPVLDVTLRVPGDHAYLNHTYYLSAGYKQSWIDRTFWVAQRPQLLLAAAFVVAGLAALLLGLRFTLRRLERTRLQQEQGVLARTSLLTERGMLASILAHEVRSPLTALRFNLHALRMLIATGSPRTERKIELSESCDREIRRLDLMLNDFLTRTQVISPAENTPVNRVAGEAIDFMRRAFEQHGIRIITHFDAGNPTVIINAAELRQVLLNLYTNALEAMTRGGTLAVSTLSEQDTVSLLVRDSGAGIPREIQERIFEPFFSTKPQGSGLGLALVRRVISGAGGKVFCESTAGEGTTFRLVLPRGSSAQPVAPMKHIAPEFTPSPNPGPAGSEQPRTIDAEPAPEDPERLES